MGIQLIDKADLWKSALLLQLRLRERLRIAVDDHRNQTVTSSPDGYLSRFRAFREKSLPSPPALYRRRVCKDLAGEEESALFRMLQAVAVPLIGNACHVLFAVFIYEVMPNILQVTVIIGDPIHFNDLLETEGAKHVPRKQLYDAVSSRIGQRLNALKVQVDKVSLEQEALMSLNAKAPSDRATEIIHRVDWDSFGMGAQFLEESSTINNQIAQTDDHVVSNCLDRPVPKRGLSSEGGLSMRIKKFMDSTEIMGFAARGLFANDYKNRIKSASFGKIRPLKAWKEYSEAYLGNRGSTALSMH